MPPFTVIDTSVTYSTIFINAIKLSNYDSEMNNN